MTLNTIVEAARDSYHTWLNTRIDAGICHAGDYPDWNDLDQDERQAWVNVTNVLRARVRTKVMEVI